MNLALACDLRSKSRIGRSDLEALRDGVIVASRTVQVGGDAPLQLLRGDQFLLEEELAYSNCHER